MMLHHNLYSCNFSKLIILIDMFIYEMSTPSRARVINHASTL